jgi:hypothetical protein
MPRDLKNYISVRIRGRDYFYFRPSTASLRKEFPTVRLSDDPAKARVQAAALKRLTSDRATVGLYRYVGAMLKEARGRARREGIAFSLAPAEVFEVLANQDGRCAVCGLGLSAEDELGPLAPRLDRVDRATAFHAANIRIVSAAVGTAIDAWGLEAFLAMAKGAASEPRPAPRPKRSPPAGGPGPGIR